MGQSDTSYWRRVGDDLFAFVHNRDGWGWSNTGVVVGAAQCVLIDAMGDHRRTEHMLRTLEVELTVRKLDAVVLTSPDGIHSFGSERLPRGLPMISSAAVRHSIGRASNVRFAEFATSGHGVVGEYLARKLDGLEPRPATIRLPGTTFTGKHSFRVGDRQVRLIELLPTGETAVHVPDADVVFTGSLCRTNGVPMPTFGSLDAHILACRRILELRPAIVVPGHGAPLGRLAVEDTIDLLDHVRSEATPLLLDGVSIAEASQRLRLRRFEGWADLEWVVGHVAGVHVDLQLSMPWTPAQVLLATAKLGSLDPAAGGAGDRGHPAE